LRLARLAASISVSTSSSSSLGVGCLLDDDDEDDGGGNDAEDDDDEDDEDDLWSSALVGLAGLVAGDGLAAALVVVTAGALVSDLTGALAGAATLAGAGLKIESLSLGLPPDTGALVEVAPLIVEADTAAFASSTVRWDTQSSSTVPLEMVPESKPEAYCSRACRMKREWIRRDMTR
jgi:hypothetical protein